MLIRSHGTSALSELLCSEAGVTERRDRSLTWIACHVGMTGAVRLKKTRRWDSLLEWTRVYWRRSE
jgi:hypothetical protein